MASRTKKQQSNSVAQANSVGNSVARGIRPQFNFNSDQAEAYRLATMDRNKYLLFYGPSRSGKSFLIMYIVFLRALSAPNSRHAIFRGARNACETTLFKLTMPQVLNKCFPGYSAQCDIKVSDMTITLPNGSLISFDGLDADRMDKVLGNEFNTVWINECNDDEIDYGTVSQLMSRLSVVATKVDGAPLVNKMLFDCNPRHFSDWEYKAFKLHVNPEDGDAMPDPDEWVSAKLNTTANLENIAAGYIKTLEAGSQAKRQRFLLGEWSDENTNALFTEKMFRDNRIAKPAHVLTPRETLDYLRDQGVELRRLTIACDPAVTADPKSDLTGITVQAIEKRLDGTDHAYVLADYSDRYTPDAACQVIKQAYLDWGAVCVIMEKNQGGLWLEAALRKHFPNVPLKFVSANATTGGKASRAEPVAQQYERGVVHHVGTQRDLEAQMCDFGSPASRRKSPDRMDAVVWGLSELFDLGHEKTRTSGYTPIQVRRLR